MDGTVLGQTTWYGATPSEDGAISVWGGVFEINPADKDTNLACGGASPVEYGGNTVECGAATAWDCANGAAGGGIMVGEGAIMFGGGMCGLTFNEMYPISVQYHPIPCCKVSPCSWIMMAWLVWCCCPAKYRGACDEYNSKVLGAKIGWCRWIMFCSTTTFLSLFLGLIGLQHY